VSVAASELKVVVCRPTVGTVYDVVSPREHTKTGSSGSSSSLAELLAILGGQLFVATTDGLGFRV
jgi:hypothetical protein